MNKIPAISVVMPVYNAENFLVETIESVLNQTFKDFEFIMINDGSTDGSLNILKHYAVKDSRCIVLDSHNRGIVASFNHGINLAKAEIICRMDADDIIMPKKFERQIEYLYTHPECVAVGTDTLLIDPEGLPINTWIYENTHDEIDASNLAGTNGLRICNASVAMRRSSFMSVGGYRPDFEWAEDYDFFLRLAEIGKLASLPEVLYKYRQHVSSVGHAKRKLQLAASLKALEDAHKRRQLTFDSRSAFLKLADDYSSPSMKDIHLKWGWWALSERNYQTSIKHAIKAIFQKPLSFEGLNLLACALRDCMKQK